MNIQLIVAYDGTHFLGWQKTPDGPTIEAELQQVLEQIYQEPLQLQAASRTDRGVHAEGQVLNYQTEKTKDLEKLKFSLNQMLPQAIRVLAIKEAADTFHPTVDAVGKEYHYFVTTDPVQSPFDRHFSWHYYHPFDLDKIRQAATFFIGTHDFSAFCNVHFFQTKDTVRTVKRLDIMQEGNQLKFEVEGTHFLYKMVRNIVGTLVYVGAGKLSLQEVEALLTKKDRRLAGMTAPAQGLVLKKVFYKVSGG